MIELSLYVDTYRYENRKITIDPNHVESILETVRRRPNGSVQPVAIIRMQSGVEYIVDDHFRKVTAAIQKLRLAQA